MKMHDSAIMHRACADVAAMYGQGVYAAILEVLEQAKAEAVESMLCAQDSGDMWRFQGAANSIGEIINKITPRTGKRE